MPVQEVVKGEFNNVAESYPLYDTVIISPLVTSSLPQFMNPGWVNSFAALGGQGQISFFNARSRSVGLAYNNQDARDIMPYAFEAYSIGVSFFGNALACDDDEPRDTEEQCQHVFQLDVPRHCSLELVVNQDSKFRSPALIAQPGYGVVGGGFAHGNLLDVLSDNAAPQALPVDPSRSYMFGNQGQPIRQQRWPFAVPIQIPRTASLSVVITPNDYARALLQSLSGPTAFIADNADSHTGRDAVEAYAGIQVSLYGRRLVQQRGELHV